jgi:hypothetical protein
MISETIWDFSNLRLLSAYSLMPWQSVLDISGCPCGARRLSLVHRQLSIDIVTGTFGRSVAVMDDVAGFGNVRVVFEGIT